MDELKQMFKLLRVDPVEDVPIMERKMENKHKLLVLVYDPKDL